MQPCVDDLHQRREGKIFREPEALGCSAHAVLTNQFPHTVRVIAPFVVAGKHLLQHEHHTWHQALALGTTKLSLWESISVRALSM